MKVSGKEIAGIVFAFIFVAIAIFFIVVAVRAGADGVSFIEALKQIFGITATAPVDPTPTDPVVETIAALIN